MRKKIEELIGSWELTMSIESWVILTNRFVAPPPGEKLLQTLTKPIRTCLSGFYWSLYIKFYISGTLNSTLLHLTLTRTLKNAWFECLTVILKQTSLLKLISSDYLIWKWSSMSLPQASAYFTKLGEVLYCTSQLSFPTIQMKNLPCLNSASILMTF